MEFETEAIHAVPPDPEHGALTPPIYQTSTFAQDAVGEPRGDYDYSRAGNPTRAAYELTLARLEGATDGFAFASGLAATDTVLRLRPSAKVVCVADVYGGSFRLFDKVFSAHGYEFSYVAAAELSADPASHLAGADLVWLETPTNPLLSLVDIAAVCAAKPKDALVAVDNTFATPYLQRPLELGADLVVHSASKYLGGHADLIGGAVLTRDAALADQLRFLQMAVGAVQGPFDSWLALRGLKTLALRVERQSRSAMTLAIELERHPRVKQVFYPGLPSHPGHPLATRQMPRGYYGGMISFLATSADEAARICAATRLFILAESLGGVESLIEQPARMTHASSGDSSFAVPAELIRLSIGVEAVADLLADLEQALAPD
jgi:cystathionine gamma-synthase